MLLFVTLFVTQNVFCCHFTAFKTLERVWVKTQSRIPLTVAAVMQIPASSDENIELKTYFICTLKISLIDNLKTQSLVANTKAVTLFPIGKPHVSTLNVTTYQQLD